MPLVRILFAAVLLVAGCASAPESPYVDPMVCEQIGRLGACECLNGDPGLMSCGEDRRWGECRCTAADAGSDAKRD